MLDIMDSLKDQFENIKERMRDHRENKKKYTSKRGGLGSKEVTNNRSLFEYMSPQRNRPDL